MSNLNQNQKAALVDELGSLKATMAPLAKREKEIKALLIAEGEKAIDGHLFRVTVSHIVSKKTDFKKIALKVGFSRQMETAYTSESESDRVTCKALIA